MSVKVPDRTLSKCEAVWYATQMQLEFRDFCIRDFGLMSKEYIMRPRYSYANCTSDNKYADNCIVLLNRDKKKIMELVDHIVEETRLANKNRLRSIKDCNYRLKHQGLAMDYCELLVGKLQNIIDTFVVDINVYERYIKMIDQELNLIKGWIAYTNTKKKDILGGF